MQTAGVAYYSVTFNFVPCHSRASGNPKPLVPWIPHQVRNDKPYGAKPHLIGVGALLSTLAQANQPFLLVGGQVRPQYQHVPGNPPLDLAVS